MKISLRQIFRGLYRLCACNCGKLINIVDKRGRPRKFLKGHDKRGKPFLFAKKGKDHYNWKGGRKRSNNYYFLLLPNYYRSDSLGYIAEHIYFYEQCYQCCILPWGVVHHIIPVSKEYCNNMIYNLMGMMESKHLSLHKKGKPGKKKDMSDRFCKYCNGKTIIRSNGYENWLGNEIDGWICQRCYDRLRNNSSLTEP